MSRSLTLGTDVFAHRSPVHVSTESTRPRRSRVSDAGMVTVEFVAATLAAAIVVAMLMWLAALLSWQLRIHDTAWESARQLARGQSWTQVLNAAAQRDPATHLTLQRDDALITITAERVVSAPGFFPDLTLDTRVTAMVEP